MGAALTLLHHLHHIPRAVLQLLDHLLDLAGRLLRLLRQVADLVGHDGEAASLLAGAGRLDCRVEGEQVGLLGNAANGHQDGVDVLAVAGQRLHHLHRAADLVGQFGDGRAGVLHDVPALIGRAIGIVGGFGGLGRVARHVLGGGGHFVHGSGHQLDFRQLGLHALVGADGDVGGVLGGIAHFLHRADDLADHALQAREEGVEAGSDLA